MTNATEFTKAIINYYSIDEKTIDFYSKLYFKMHEKKLLDSNFVSQMSDREKTMHRLSELVILEHCSRCLNDISSKNKGPDFTFEFESKKINVEIITPIQVTLKKSQFTQYIFPPPQGQSPNRGSVDVNVPEMSSLHERITGALKAKVDKYQEYLEKKTVDDSDTNIVCINLGFIEGSDHIDYPYLKNLFTKQAAVHLEIGSDSEVSAKIIDHDFIVVKLNKTVLTTSYFDNFKFDHVDGIWLTCCNEKNLNTFSNNLFPDNSDSNVLYHNYKSKIPSSLLSILQINSPHQEEDFIAKIRVDKKIPKS